MLELLRGEYPLPVRASGQAAGARDALPLLDVRVIDELAFDPRDTARPLLVLWPPPATPAGAPAAWVHAGGTLVWADDRVEHGALWARFGLEPVAPDELAMVRTYRGRDELLVAVPVAGEGVAVVGDVGRVVTNVPTGLRATSDIPRAFLELAPGVGLGWRMGIGAGRLWVIGDPSVWINLMLPVEDNAGLLVELVRAMCADRAPCPIDVYIGDPDAAYTRSDDAGQGAAATDPSPGALARGRQRLVDGWRAASTARPPPSLARWLSLCLAAFFAFSVIVTYPWQGLLLPLRGVRRPPPPGAAGSLAGSVLEERNRRDTGLVIALLAERAHAALLAELETWPEAAEDERTFRRRIVAAWLTRLARRSASSRGAARWSARRRVRRVVDVVRGLGAADADSLPTARRAGSPRTGARATVRAPRPSTHADLCELWTTLQELADTSAHPGRWRAVLSPERPPGVDRAPRPFPGTSP